MARREHSTEELRFKLLSKGFESHELKGVLDGLRDEGLLSDQRFTEAFVSSRVRRGYGPLRIRAELNERGVNDALIAMFVDINGEVWQEQIKNVRNKRFGHQGPKDFKERAKQARFLQYRGFTSDQIRGVLKKSPAQGNR